VAANERRRPGPKPKPLAERILSNIYIDERGCWIWRRRLDRYGYGQIEIIRRPERRSTKAHIVAYEVWIGPIPPGKEIDHTCRVHACCNPDHLEAVTRKENLDRGIGYGRTGVSREEVRRGLEQR
jgi:glucan biosynthesis protein